MEQTFIPTNTWDAPATAFPFRTHLGGSNDLPLGDSVLVNAPGEAAQAELARALQGIGLEARICGQTETPQSTSVAEPVCHLATADALPALLHRGEPALLAPPLVVVLTQAARDSSRLVAKAHAFDVLTTPLNQAEFARVVTAAAEEGRLRRAFRHKIAQFRGRLARLSRDENDVLEAVCDGHLNKQIARDLKISVRTVEQRRRRVFEKMEVPSAVTLALQLSAVRTLELLNR